MNLQGGSPGYEGALNSAFEPDGSRQRTCLDRALRVIGACDRNGAVVLGCFSQRQDQILRDEAAVRKDVVNAARWIAGLRHRNAMLEITNEFGHKGFDHVILKTPPVRSNSFVLRRPQPPDCWCRRADWAVARAADFLLIHFNNTRLDDIATRIATLKSFGKPIVCKEDDRSPVERLEAVELSAAGGASWGLMRPEYNQRFPFEFHGAADTPEMYARLRHITGSRGWSYLSPPESRGGWRKLEKEEDIRATAGLDPEELASLREWLLGSDQRDFAAVVIRHGYVVLEVERNANSVTATGNVKSCAKAICATVAGIAVERGRLDATPRRMTLDDPAFDFLAT